MSPPQKQPAATRLGDGGARPETRKFKPDDELAKRDAKSANARIREQSKRVNQPNIDQQGHRANVRQNATRQGNRRSA